MFTAVECKTVLKGEISLINKFKIKSVIFCELCSFSWHLNILPRVKHIFFIYFFTLSNYTGFEKATNYWNTLLYCGCALPVGNVMRKNSEQQFCDGMRWFLEVLSILGFCADSWGLLLVCVRERRGKERNRIILLLSNVALQPDHYGSTPLLVFLVSKPSSNFAE